MHNFLNKKNMMKKKQEQNTTDNCSTANSPLDLISFFRLEKDSPRSTGYLKYSGFYCLETSTYHLATTPAMAGVAEIKGEGRMEPFCGH